MQHQWDDQLDDAAYAQVDGVLPTSMPASRAELGGREQFLMAEANKNFMNNDFQAAWDLCKEVIRYRPDLPDPYLTMALVAEERNNMRKAAELYYMACQFDRQAADMWRRAAAQLQKCEDWERVNECHSNVLRLEPHDENSLWDRHYALVQLKKPVSLWRCLGVLTYKRRPLLTIWRSCSSCVRETCTLLARWPRCTFSCRTTTKVLRCCAALSLRPTTTG